jgi:hypothetical protein
LEPEGAEMKRKLAWAGVVIVGISRAGVVIVGLSIIALFLYAFIFVIPSQFVEMSLKDMAIGALLALLFFGFIGWFYWGIQYLAGSSKI